jgi:transcriptional regulator with XRE-family HTH domain
MCNKRRMSKLRDYLTATGKSQRAFAREADIDTSFLSRLCSGEARPGLDLAFRLERLTAGAVPASSWTAEASAPSEGEAA